MPTPTGEQRLTRSRALPRLKIETCANNRDTSGTLGYDSAGNVTSVYNGVTTNTFVYDAQERIASMDSGSTAYTYDANGERARKDSGGSWTEYVRFGGSVLAENHANSGSGQWTDYIFAGGARLAEATTGNPTSPATTTTYYGGDQIGSARIMTNGSGSTAESYEYYPFGQGPAPDSTNHYLFTGKERDSESGNDYFGARYYGSSMGRFLSPDDGIDQDFYDPQSWNLYSYVRNNPLNRVDADGRQVTVCSFITNADGSTGQTCNTISDDAYKAAVAAQQAANANNPPYSGVQAPWGDHPNGAITDNGQIVGTATWSPNPTPDNGAVIPGDMGLGLVVGGMASDYVVGRVAGALFGRAAGAATEGTVSVAASGASKALLTDGTKQAARDIVDGLADGAQKASAKRFINAVQPGREVSITMRSDGTMMMSVTRPGANGFQGIVKAIGVDGQSATFQMGVNAAGEIEHFDPKF